VNRWKSTVSVSIPIIRLRSAWGLPPGAFRFNPDTSELAEVEAGRVEGRIAMEGGFNASDIGSYIVQWANVLGESRHYQR
jgi:hypothetical protein